MKVYKLSVWANPEQAYYFSQEAANSEGDRRNRVENARYRVDEEEIAESEAWDLHCEDEDEQEWFKCRDCGTKYHHKSFSSTKDVSICVWCSGERK